ncbi:MAG TPA: SprB repeat-containing protein [Chitinophagales bacterium]|nr:SprB repeat-containing protein [Chitinophagales bacterium]
MFFSLNAKAQIPTTHYNIDISNLSTTSLSANDVLTFSLTTRIYSGDPNTQCPGLEIFLQDLQYQINLGSIDTIWFSDIRDNGTIGQIATSNGGTVTVQVADVVDADNESLGTTAGSNPATLAFCGDGEHNACTCGDTSVSGPCVTGTCPKSYPIPDITFVITYAIPSTVPTGTYTITATESMDVYFGYAAPMLIQSNNTVSYPETYQPPRTFDVVAPTPMELCLGDTIDLSVPAYLVGSGAVTWYKDNTVISGASGATFAATEIGTYSAMISDGTCQRQACGDIVIVACPVCSLTVDSAIPSTCNPITNTYNLAVTVSYTNQPTGDITINVGGTDYTFTPDGTSPDTYTVTGLTSNGATGIDVSATFVGDASCTHTLADAYNAPASCSCNLTATATGTPVSCNGGSDGTASATPSGNTGSVTYLWNNGETTASINGLTAGTYTVTVTESATCTAVAIYDVTQPPLIDITCTKTDVTTNGGSDGSASLNATGGTSPYTYLWSSGETTSSISGKTSGSYTVTVTDDNGCTAICNSTIQEPGCNLSATATGTPVSCNGGNDGTASATPSGNLSSVTYLWNNGETTASISDLTVGTYTVTVTESATCTAVAIYDVTQPPLMDITCTKTDVTTNGGSDGTASVNATGGTSPYTYLWNSGETTSSISGKTSGNYTVTVTDDNGCTAMCNSTIQEPGCNLSATATGTPVSCNGGSDGTASATPSGNLSSVTYLWNNGETTASISGLTAGTYTVTVTESATCTAIAIYDVTQPPLMDITCTKTDVTTNGGSDGTASVNATGGTSPYTYLWSSGETTSSISGKPSGTYTVTVTDDNGCTAMCNSTINEPGALCNLTAAGLGNVMCNNNGTTADASDDYISFTLNPTGTTLGSSYVITVSSGSITPTTAGYGQTTTFQLQNGSAGSGNTVTITITDLTDTNCKIQVDIPDTGSCSTPSCPPIRCLPVTLTKQQ